MTAKALSVEEFLSLAAHTPVVDVRSPAEYQAGHIAGAVNLPLFDNAQRAEIGTLYKQQGPQAAIDRGLEIVGPQMAHFVRQARAQVHQDSQGRLLVHCWRGGMRSGSMAWLFNTAGLKSQTLAGGYKAYRQYLLQSLAAPRPLLILGGYTGSGKTEVLHHLGRLGQQVIDLEALAHHKGSVFGGLGQGPQPSTEQFENNLFDQWQRLDPLRPLWLEDESAAIGHVRITPALWQQMNAAPVLLLQLPTAVRVARLVAEYAQFEADQLAQGIVLVRKRLGPQLAQEALKALAAHDFEKVAQLLLNYYDKAYTHGLETKRRVPVYRLPLPTDQPDKNAAQVLAAAKRLGLLP